MGRFSRVRVPVFFVVLLFAAPGVLSHFLRGRVGSNAASLSTAWQSYVHTPRERTFSRASARGLNAVSYYWMAMAGLDRADLAPWWDSYDEWRSALQGSRSFSAKTEAILGAHQNRVDALRRGAASQFTASLLPAFPAVDRAEALRTLRLAILASTSALSRAAKGECASAVDEVSSLLVLSTDLARFGDIVLLGAALEVARIAQSTMEELFRSCQLPPDKVHEVAEWAHGIGADFPNREDIWRAECWWRALEASRSVGKLDWYWGILAASQQAEAVGALTLGRRAMRQCGANGDPGYSRSDDVRKEIDRAWQELYLGVRLAILLVMAEDYRVRAGTPPQSIEALGTYAGPVSHVEFELLHNQGGSGEILLRGRSPGTEVRRVRPELRLRERVERPAGKE